MQKTLTKSFVVILHRVCIELWQNRCTCTSKLIHYDVSCYSHKVCNVLLIINALYNWHSVYSVSTYRHNIFKSESYNTTSNNQLFYIIILCTAILIFPELKHESWEIRYIYAHGWESNLYLMNR